MNIKLRTFVAGVVGMMVTFGIAELVHGFYEPVPSVPLAVAQRIVTLTPGSTAEFAIGILGQADVPFLITTTVVLTLIFAGLLTLLALRSVIATLVGVSVLGAVALATSFAEPSVRPIIVFLTVVLAIGAGTGVAGFLMYASGFQGEGAAAPSPEPSGPDQKEPQGSRYREAGSEGGIAVSRRNFIVFSGTAAVAGLGAAGAGRLLEQQGVQFRGSKRPSRRQGSRPRLRLERARFTWRSSSRGRGTWRCRLWVTERGTSSTSTSGSARCSADGRS